MELELSNLLLKYAALRVLDPARVARLVAALSREDQRSPVLVVGHVLVDGYHRVEALRELGRDVVLAVRIEVPEAEALVLAWRLETGRRKNALEEGWLLVELAETHGLHAVVPVDEHVAAP
jgi:ParB family transcriptional regulator, chromosome partitioning protein